jgi:acid phosphatase
MIGSSSGLQVSQSTLHVACLYDARITQHYHHHLFHTLFINHTYDPDPVDTNMLLQDDRLEQLTSTGPFSGTLGSFTTGVRLRTRYKHLLDKAISSCSARPIRFWASDSQRVIETARHFALGFFGIDYQTNNTAALEVISEHSSLAGDTLTPGRTCLNNKKDTVNGQKKGYNLMGEYRAIYMQPIRLRLHAQISLNFTDTEIYAMQEMCGFETTVRGRSDWCDVFTQDEFLSFEYARDLLHYYRAGPGQKYAASMGWLWLNATTNLLLEGPAAGPLFFSFVHDGDIAPMMTALDVINDAEHLPVTHIPHERKWRKSQVSPMGGRIIFERLACQVEDTPGVERFVRLNINDGITAIPDCQSGPGKSCPLRQFAARTRERGEVVGDFREMCGLDEGVEGRIKFLHQ